MRLALIALLMTLAAGCGGNGSMMQSIRDAQANQRQHLRAEAEARIREIQSRVTQAELNQKCTAVFSRSSIAIARTRIATDWRPSVRHTCFARKPQLAIMFGDDPVMAAYVANAGHKYDFSDEETATMVSCIVAVDQKGVVTFTRGSTKGEARNPCHQI